MTLFDRGSFVEKFVQEAREYLEVLNRGLVDLEKSPEDTELLTRLLRAAHTLKGSSRMLKYMDVNQVSHCLEDVLEDVRDGRLEMNMEVGDAFFLALDEIDVCIEDIAGGGEGDRDVSAVCRSLESLRAEGEPASAADAEAGDGTTEEQAGAESGSEERVPLEIARSEPGVEGSSASEVEEERSDEPAKKSSAPAVEETLRIGTSGLDATIRLAGEIRVSGMRLDHHLDELAEMCRGFRHYQGEIERYLEGMNGQAGELKRFCQETKGLYAQIDGLYRKYREDLAGLERMAAELQEKTLDMRMLPLSTVFDSLPRAVRDLSRAFGKEIELIVEGAETHMDKKLIERLDGPIVHMVRNCIDHGIETPEERKKAGKSARGQLRIAASQEGDHIAIVVEDDGGGIDLEAVKKKALTKGLIDREQLERIPEREIANFIFLPGFSTAPIITDISGRGVGMDVVRSTVEELKGAVSVETEKGVGSRFILQLPMTLTTIRAMLIECAGFSFAVPVGYITETVKIGLGDIIQIVDREAISLKNQMIPVARLDRVLGLEDPGLEGKERFPVLVLRSGHEHIALIVDEIIDEQDILLKPIPPHMGKTPCVSGVSIFGDNQISVVLHAPGVADSMKNIAGLQPVEARRGREGMGREILVVDDSLNTREIEKSILESYGYEVDLARDGIEGLNMVQNKLYDMIVTDLDMPRMDGFTLVERLRQEPDFAHIPIVIVTSREKEEDKKRGIEVGADAYILKGGFDQSNLIDTIESLIG
jgi:two-component system, chemotaxis family, sensor kinase CheA